jgi:hypothetical protein
MEPVSGEAVPRGGFSFLFFWHENPGKKNPDTGPDVQKNNDIRHQQVRGISRRHPHIHCRQVNGRQYSRRLRLPRPRNGEMPAKQVLMPFSAPLPRGKSRKITDAFIKAGMNQHSAVFSVASLKPCFSLETPPQARGITNPDIRTAPKRGNPSRLSGILAERIKKNMISIKNQSFPAFNSAAGRTHLLQK